MILKLLAYSFGLFFPKNRRIILFSEWFGKSHVDSPWYLFEYAVRQEDYKCFWITKSHEEYAQLSNEYPNILFAYSLKAIWLQCIAWTLVSSVSARDFFWPALLRRKNYIQLCHGMPFKTSYGQRYTRLVRVKNAIRRLTIDNYSWIGSSGPKFDKIIAEQYFKREEEILRMPNIRCTRFNECSAALKSNTDENIRLIYMPTHRDEGKSFEKVKKNVEDIANILSHNVKYIFYVKLHHYDVKFIEEIRGIKGVNIVYNDVEVFPVCDVFIGDYSGVVWDSFQLDQYRIAYIPDKEVYLDKHRDLYFEHEDIYDAVAFSPDELKFILQTSKSKNDKVNIDGFISYRGLEGLPKIGFNNILKTVK